MPKIKMLELSPRERTARLVLAFALSVLLAWLCLHVAQVFLRQVRTAYSSLRWPYVEGVVVSTSKESTTTTDGLHGCLAKILYRYEINGITYESDLGRAIGGAAQIATCADVQSRFPAGQKVDVFYDPANPGTAVLVRGDFSDATVYLLPLAVGIFISACLFMLFFLARDFSRVRRARFNGLSYTVEEIEMSEPD